MKDEAVMGVRTMALDEGFSAGIRISQLKTQLNLSNMLHDLPAVVKEVEDQIAHKESKLATMKASQEKGEI